MSYARTGCECACCQRADAEVARLTAQVRYEQERNANNIAMAEAKVEELKAKVEALSRSGWRALEADCHDSPPDGLPCPTEWHEQMLAALEAEPEDGTP